MKRYFVKVSDSNGRSANVMYVRQATSYYKVEYFDTKNKVGEEYFNTEYEATRSAQQFTTGEQSGNYFKFFKW